MFNVSVVDQITNIHTILLVVIRHLTNTLTYLLRNTKKTNTKVNYDFKKTLDHLIS